ncbi:MAG: hypothetical protein JO353_00135 [Phycisphaerae bacterium]|nr:hypothetical protein [Phycisphaerae bacterium]
MRLKIRVAAWERRCTRILWTIVFSFTASLCAGATIGINVAGLSQPNTTAQEPDISGAAGPSSYAEFVNGAFGVFNNSTGVIRSQTTDQTFWQNAGISASALSDGASNPRLIYDPNSARWFATEITNTSSGNKILLAASSSSDPTSTPGSWSAISFPAAQAHNEFSYGDFPTLGLDANGVYIAVDNYNGPPQQGADYNNTSSLFSIPKADLISKTPAITNMTAFYGQNYESLGYILQPVIDFNPIKSKAVVVADNYDPLGAMGAINRFNIIGTTASGATLSSTQTTQLTQYAYPPSPRQPNGSGGFSIKPGISIPDDRYASSAYQIGNLIYTVHTVGLPADAVAPSSCAIQWSVLRLTSEDKTELVQQGMITDSNHDYFNPSISANAAGDVVIGYNRSGPNASDGMILSFVAVGSTSNGTISFGSSVQLSTTTVTGFHNSSGLWGDYSSMSPDPSNPSIFWFAQEIPLASSAGLTTGDTWGTEITEIVVPEPKLFVWILAVVLIAGRRRFCESHRFDSTGIIDAAGAPLTPPGRWIPDTDPESH